MGRTTFDPSLVGRRSSVHEHRYGRRDVALYALSVGAGPDDLRYVTDGPEHIVLPSFAVIATLETCRELLVALAGGLEGAVHRSERLLLHGAIPREGSLFTRGEIVSVVADGDMAEVTGRTWTRDATSRFVAETDFDVVYRGVDARNAGERLARRRFPLPRREPDFRRAEPTLPVQALMYSLNGDGNPIHLDPNVARRAGFPRPILHGLCLFGCICREALRRSQGRDLVALEAEFRGPAFPGETLLIDGWNEGGEVAMRVSTQERAGVPVMKHVRARFATERNAQ